jgi:hypothetical protein
MGVNKKRAGEISEKLLEFSNSLIDDEGDPGGRTFSLGVCLFAGAVLATMKEEDRDAFCDAARGYAITCLAALAEE